MDKLKSQFIANANKSNQKPIELYSAHTGKRYHPGDEHNLTKDDFYFIIAAMCVIGFITYIALGG